MPADAKGSAARRRSPRDPARAALPAARIGAALLAWFERYRRPLAWRGTRDAYRVWVAEVMLQQTRIAVVEPRYRAFLARFPDLSSLARAAQDAVLAEWSGLGYYARARALHRAAQLLERSGTAEFPCDPAAALALPGVGEYTAAAVLSIAYGVRLAAVDGNTVRVLSRLARIDRRPDPRGEPYRTLAGQLLHRERPGEWNEALMELGETICTPRAPRCPDCPIARWCGAYRDGTVALHPPPRQRRAPERIAVDVTVVSDARGRLLLERGAFPYLRRLWLPPTRVREANGRAPATARPGRVSFKHQILHREIHVTVTRRIVGAAALRRRAERASDGVERRVFAPAEIAAIGRSALLTKALAAAAPGARR